MLPPGAGGACGLESQAKRALETLDEGGLTNAVSLLLYDRCMASASCGTAAASLGLPIGFRGPQTDIGISISVWPKPVSDISPGLQPDISVYLFISVCICLHLLGIRHISVYICFPARRLVEEGG